MFREFGSLPHLNLFAGDERYGIHGGARINLRISKTCADEGKTAREKVLGGCVEWCGSWVLVHCSCLLPLDPQLCSCPQRAVNLKTLLEHLDGISSVNQDCWDVPGDSQSHV